jgi:hypothetical protein
LEIPEESEFLNFGITLIEGDEIGAHWVSSLVALDQVVKKVDASRIMNFHSRVATAQEFATSEPRGISHYLDDYDVQHVNGCPASGLIGQIGGIIQRRILVSSQ